MIDRKLGPYRITEEIGAGGMATVYRAYQPSMDRHVAIKVIRSSALLDATLRDRFQREARLIARLEHPHLLPVYDFDGDHDPPYIVMRYLEGGTLRQVQAQGALPHGEVLYTLGQVASALDYAHRQGVVHRDLKPSNIMIDREGNAFVTDFGIARIADAPENLTGTGHLVGTPAYMSPEQARGLPDVDAAADRYALGVIVFELLTGRPPYEHASSLGLLMSHLNDEIPSARARDPRLPEAVDAVLRTALAKDRAARHPSASALVADLARALDTRSSDAPSHLQSVTQVLSLDQLKAFEERARQGAEGPASTPTPSDQQRQMTAVHFDTTGLSEALYESGLDAEGVRNRLAGLWARFDEIAREGGGVIQSKSDETGLALWGRARISEDDPERAIRAALAMRAATLEESRRLFGPDWQPSDEEPLPFAAGITTGPILLERDSDSGTYSASGVAITVAGRVREAAAPGEILLAHDTFTQVRGVFTLHPHDPIRLRGRKEPLEVYLVTAAKPRAFRLKARGIEGVETKMVGREIELRLLQEALTLTLEDRETQVVTVVGEAGVGKSRLLFEFSNWTELIDETVWLFEARATQPSMLQPFSLTRDLFSFRFQILDSDSIDTVHRKFVEGVAGFLGPDSAEKAQLIGQLVGFDFSAAPAVVEALKDGEAFRQRGLELLGEFFAAACRVNPAVLYIEDIHWADDRSLDLINLLVRDNARLPLFVMCMARPSLYERRPQWGEGQHFHEKIVLEPLSQLSSRRLVRELLKKLPEVPTALRDLVVERADGNPFYIEELVRTLIDDGVVVKGEPDWSVDETRLSGVRIPSTLTGVLQSRLDTLAPGLQQLLQRASVLGRVFWDAAAVFLSKPAGADEDEVQSMLEELRRREMILRREESGFAGTVEYVFRHAILRDVTYETIVPRQRRALHRQVGDWLLEMGGERAREHVSLVAEHYERAGEPVRAAAQLIHAGRAALQVGAYDEAIATLLKARGLVADRGDDAVRIEVEATLGEVQSLHGERRLAQKTLEDILPAARRAGDRVVLVRVLGNLVRNANWLDDMEASRVYLEEVLPLTREIGDERSLMFILRQAGNFVVDDAAKARPYFEESLALARKLGDTAGESAVLNSMGNMHQYQSDWEAARALYEDAIRAAQRSGDRFMEAIAHENLGGNFVWMRDYEAGRGEIETARRLAQQLGLALDEGSAEENLGFLEAHRGDDAAAAAHLAASLRLYRGQGDAPPSLLLLYAVLEGRRGDHRRASAWARLALSRGHAVRSQLLRQAAHFEADLRGPLSDEEVAAARAAGEGLDLAAVFDEIAARDASA